MKREDEEGGYVCHIGGQICLCCKEIDEDLEIELSYKLYRRASGVGDNIELKRS